MGEKSEGDEEGDGDRDRGKEKREVGGGREGGRKRGMAEGGVAVMHIHVHTSVSLAHSHMWMSPIRCWSCVALQGQGRATSPNCWLRSSQASLDWGELLSSSRSEEIFNQHVPPCCYS